MIFEDSNGEQVFLNENMKTFKCSSLPFKNVIGADDRFLARIDLGFINHASTDYNSVYDHFGEL